MFLVFCPLPLLFCFVHTGYLAYWPARRRRKHLSLSKSSLLTFVPLLAMPRLTGVRKLDNILNHDFTLYLLGFLRKDRDGIPLTVTALSCSLIVVTLWQPGVALREVNDQQFLPVPTFRRSVQTFRSIAELHLFGWYNENLAYLPPTSLQLNLKGIALSITFGDNSSRALIAVPGQPCLNLSAGGHITGWCDYSAYFS